jgi:hypothetical protein
VLIRTFVCEKHEEQGELGWRQKNKPHFDAYAGMAVAHDCLEHLPNDRESIEYEALAFGAMFHVRAGIYSQSMHDIWEDIQADCVDVFRLYRYEGRAFNSPSENMSKPLRDKNVEYQIVRLIKSLPSFLRRENSYDYDHSDSDNSRLIDIHIERFIRNMDGWIREGFRRSKRRWRYSSYVISHVFQDICIEADRRLNHALEGDELKIIINMRRGHAEIIHLDHHDLHPEEYQDEEAS